MLDLTNFLDFEGSASQPRKLQHQALESLNPETPEVTSLGFLKL